MSARERTVGVRCADRACDDIAHYSYSSQREYGEIMRSQAEKPWKCTRHSDPDQVLRPDNLETTRVLVASRVSFRDGYLKGLFWQPEGEAPGSGLALGPGFKAHADDFPEGTRLVVTAQIEPAATVSA